MVPPEVLVASKAFDTTVAFVEEARRRLVAAAPVGRSAGAPLAGALAGFEEGLRAAAATMDSWRTDELEDVWAACSEALDESLRLAEALRLGQVPEGYEQLYGTLGDLMDPLQAFANAFERFRELGA